MGVGQDLRVNVNAESGDYTDFFRRASGRRAHLTAVIQDENDKDRTYRTYGANEMYEFVARNLPAK